MHAHDAARIADVALRATGDGARAPEGFDLGAFAAIQVAALGGYRRVLFVPEGGYSWRPGDVRYLEALGYRVFPGADHLRICWA